jgi:hypothetical protein
MLQGQLRKTLKRMMTNSSIAIDVENDKHNGVGECDEEVGNSRCRLTKRYDYVTKTVAETVKAEE